MPYRLRIYEYTCIDVKGDEFHSRMLFCTCEDEGQVTTRQVHVFKSFEEAMKLIQQLCRKKLIIPKKVETSKSGGKRKCSEMWSVLENDTKFIAIFLERHYGLTSYYMVEVVPAEEVSEGEKK